MRHRRAINNLIGHVISGNVISAVTGIVCWLALGLAGAGVAAAQDTRELRGVVLDEAGGAIAGALVEIDDGGRVVGATTDESGQYRLAPLTPERHRLRVTAAGFAPFTTDVDLRRPRTAPLAVALRVLIDERVEVFAPSAPGASGGLTSTLLMGDALLALPSDPGRMLRRLSEMAGGTGRSGEVTVTVDGFRRIVRLPPKEMIQMIRISSNPFAPEFAEPGRIRIEIVTKPGSEQFHGEFKSDFNGRWLTARNAFATEEGSMQNSGSGGSSNPDTRTQVSHRWTASRSNASLRRFFRAVQNRQPQGKLDNVALQ